MCRNKWQDVVLFFSTSQDFKVAICFVFQNKYDWSTQNNLISLQKFTFIFYFKEMTLVAWPISNFNFCKIMPTGNGTNNAIWRSSPLKEF